METALKQAYENLYSCPLKKIDKNITALINAKKNYIKNKKLHK